MWEEAAEERARERGLFAGEVTTAHVEGVGEWEESQGEGEAEGWREKEGVWEAALCAACERGGAGREPSSMAVVSHAASVEVSAAALVAPASAGLLSATSSTSSPPSMPLTASVPLAVAEAPPAAAAAVVAVRGFVDTGSCSRSCRMVRSPATAELPFTAAAVRPLPLTLPSPLPACADSKADA